MPANAKVKLPRNIAEALERAKTNGGAEHVISVLFSETNYYTGEAVVALNGYDKMTLVSALVNGYELERTAAEKLRDYWRKLDDECYENDWQAQFAATYEIHGVRKTIEILAQEYPELPDVLGGGGNE
jgi:hypothetical protein